MSPPMKSRTQRAPMSRGKHRTNGNTTAALQGQAPKTVTADGLQKLDSAAETRTDQVDPSAIGTAESPLDAAVLTTDGPGWFDMNAAAVIDQARTDPENQPHQLDPEPTPASAVPCSVLPEERCPGTGNGCCQDAQDAFGKLRAHVNDLYAALGLEFGQNPFEAIGTLQARADVRPTVSPLNHLTGDVAMVVKSLMAYAMAPNLRDLREAERFLRAAIITKSR